ncbi:glycosyltransferase, partial [Microbacterium profundi]|uniref:glycosyltransferase n=1 Tax=Microbacterium profundi TaxID=450380 RepID=UPI00051A3696
MSITRWSLITVTYNSATTLRRFWSGDRPREVEWIVVDNGSTDDSVQVARALGAQVIELSENLGFSAANNRGLKVARGSYIAFLNPDVRGKWSDLDELAKTIDAHGGLVSPQLMNADGSLQPNGRGAPLLMHKALHRLLPQRQDNGYLITAGLSEERYVFWLMGAAIMGSADVIRQLRGWNERYFLYYEDKDICIRAWDAGLTVVLDGRVNWLHGWARDTKSFRLKPWLREIDSLIRFYSLYSEFLFGGQSVARKHPQPNRLSASVASVA